MKKFAARKKRAQSEVYPNRVFGVPLDKSSNIPWIMRECIEYLIKTEGIKTEGIFRQTANLVVVMELKSRLNRGQEVNLFEVDDPHVVAYLLKLFLRELPEPLIIYELYDCFLAAVSISDIKAQQAQTKKVLHFLPASNRQILYHLCSFLKLVSSFSDSNKMTAGNLAIVFAPNILRPPPKFEEPQIAMEDTPVVNTLFCSLIEKFEEIFEDFHDEFSTPFERRDVVRERFSFSSPSLFSLYEEKPEPSFPTTRTVNGKESLLLMMDLPKPPEVEISVEAPKKVKPAIPPRRLFISSDGITHKQSESSFDPIETHSPKPIPPPKPRRDTLFVPRIDNI